MLSVVVAVADEHRLGNDAVGHVAQAHRSPGGTAQGFEPLEQRSDRIELGRRLASASGRGRAARTIISGMAASMQVTSTPSIVSMRWPVGNSDAR